VLNVRNKTGIHCHIPSRQNNFNFDWAFGPDEKQQQVYSALSSPILENIFEGVNATILAYGQTGSGKTHTIGGGDCTADATDSLESEDFGFIPRVVRDIFNEVQCQREKNSSYKADIQMSYMEVYKEDCFDLLGKDRPKVELRESGRGEVLVENLTRLDCPSAGDIHRVMKEANLGRATSATLMNAKSSRSHAILTLYLRVTRPVDMDAAPEGVENDSLVTLASRLNVVDLAGSERMKKTGASGDTLKEGIAINQGLLALGNVIEALSKKSLLSVDGAESAAMHIPYRDAKITRLLKDSLGGNNVTVLLACVSPADLHSEETMNTLRFASRAMEVINKAHANAELAAGGLGQGGISQEEGERMGIEIINLKMEVLKYQKVIAQLEQQELTGGAGPGTMVVRAGDAGVGSGYLVVETRRSYYELCRLLHSVLTAAIEENLLLDEGELEQYVAVIKKMGALYRGVQGGVTSDSLLRVKVEEAAGAVDEMELMLPVLLRCVEELDGLMQLMGAVHGFGDKSGDRASPGSSIDLADVDGPEFFSTLEGGAAGCRSGRSSDASETSVSSADLEDELPVDPQTAEIESKLSTKLDRVSKINSFLSDFEGNMASLKAEISTLQTDKLQIFNSIKATNAGGASGSARPAIAGAPPAVAGSSRPSYMSSTKGAPAFGHKPAVVAHRPFGASASSGSTSASANTNTNTNPKVVERLRSDLSSKSRLLDDKLRELKAKEQEYRQMSQEKKQVDQEVGSLRGQFDTLKAKRVALVAQLKEEKTSFQLEKKRLVQSEQLCKKRERTVAHCLSKLEHEVSNKERVWRSQLDAKERETKRLKDLIQKQTVVREMRMANTGTSISNAGGSGHSRSQGNAGEDEVAGSGSGYYTRRHQGDIKTQVLRLLNQEKLKANYTEEISLECKLRGQAARQLNLMKSRQKLDALSGLGGGDANSEAAQKEMELLETEVKSRSALILARQGAVADLDGVRQGQVSSPWDTLCKSGTDYKLAMTTMLSHVTAATNQQALQSKAFEAKIAQQNAEIRRLRAGVSSGVGLGAAKGHGQGQESKGQGKVSALPRKPGLPPVFRRPAPRKLSGDSVERLEGEQDSDEDGAEDEDSEVDSGMDSSEDEDNEEEDVDTEDEYVPGHTPHKARGGGGFAKRKRTHAAHTDNATARTEYGYELGPTGSGEDGSGRKRRALQDITNTAAGASAAVGDELRSLTVPLLKERCKLHGLPVSGRKDDLVARLLAAGDAGGQLDEEEKPAVIKPEVVKMAPSSPVKDELANCRSVYNDTAITVTAPAGSPLTLPEGRVKLSAVLDSSATMALDMMLQEWEESASPDM